ncbi:hypothetical protein ACFY4C_02700 [Actinomadura viridis]|uniref:hypothetical protein n=1 Tax=Actinomadura viridis TaxID=58110 RepID=UPI0036937A8D
MDRTTMTGLLERCLLTGSPSGAEAGLAKLVIGELDARGIPCEPDAAGNVLVRFGGTGGERPLVMVTGHLDEIGMTVKRIEEDGRLRLSPLGGSLPHKFGEGPVEVLGDDASCTGILSYGSLHSTEQSGPQYAQSPDGAAGAVHWKHWWVETKLTPERLREAGVRPGTKVTPARSRRAPVRLGEDHLSGYGMDDKVAVPILIDLAERLTRTPPAVSTVLAFTTREEIGGLGGAWAAGELRPEVLIAIEVAPVMPEYGVHAGPDPVLWNQDVYGVADGEVVRALHEAAGRGGIVLQDLVSEIGATDASCAARAGHTARPATISVACENTHGWEIVHLDALGRVAGVLEEYLRAGVGA